MSARILSLLPTKRHDHDLKCTCPNCLEKRNQRFNDAAQVVKALSIGGFVSVVIA